MIVVARLQREVTYIYYIENKCLYYDTFLRLLEENISRILFQYETCRSSVNSKLLWILWVRPLIKKNKHSSTSGLNRTTELKKLSEHIQYSKILEMQNNMSDRKTVSPNALIYILENFLSVLITNPHIHVCATVLSFALS